VFYRRHLPGVVGYLVRETGDRDASADLAAEVFAAVFLGEDLVRVAAHRHGVARRQLLERFRLSLSVEIVRGPDAWLVDDAVECQEGGFNESPRACLQWWLRGQAASPPSIVIAVPVT
jgi:hypothetical protein